jgi:hypothetical protein
VLLRLEELDVHTRLPSSKHNLTVGFFFKPIRLGLEPSTVFPAGNSGLGGWTCEILHDDQRFNRLDPKARESVEGSALVTRRFTLI